MNHDHHDAADRAKDPRTIAELMERLSSLLAMDDTDTRSIHFRKQDGQFWLWVPISDEQIWHLRNELEFYENEGESP